jgi:hypothetical protein
VTHHIGRNARKASVTMVFVPFVVLSVIGLVLSLVTHTASLLGAPQPLGAATWVLHIGIFVVWLPAVLVSYWPNPHFKRYSKDFWRELFRGCPPWMRWLTRALIAYSIVNFLLFMAIAAPRGYGGLANTPPEVFRYFSAGWMVFYSAAAAILYSAIVVSRGESRSSAPEEPYLNR